MKYFFYFFIASLMAAAPFAVGVEHQINSFKDGVVTLDDGSIWKVSEKYNNAKHYNETLANDPRTLQPGEMVNVIKWHPSSTSWQVFDQYGNEIPLTEDLFLFVTNQNEISYLTLTRPPEGSVIQDIDFDNKIVKVGDNTYKLIIWQGQKEKFEPLWKVGDPVYIASDSEMLTEGGQLIVNSINYAILKTAK